MLSSSSSLRLLCYGQSPGDYGQRWSFHRHLAAKPSELNDPNALGMSKPDMSRGGENHRSGHLPDDLRSYHVIPAEEDCELAVGFVEVVLEALAICHL